MLDHESTRKRYSILIGIVEAFDIIGQKKKGKKEYIKHDFLKDFLCNTWRSKNLKLIEKEKNVELFYFSNLTYY